MENVKSQFAAIYALLEANKNKQVKTIMPQLVELMTAKQNSKNFRKDDDGNVTHVFCYYHKEWEDVSEVDFGKKASSATGLASMCKQGVSQWTKQQRAKKDAESLLLTKLSDGTLSIDKLASAQQEIADAASAITPRI
jgi:hypothetical protein